MKKSIIRKMPGILPAMLFTLIMMAFTLWPVLYAFFGSFKTNMEFVLGSGFLPGEWHVENYVYAFQKLNFFRYSMNSLILCATSTFLAILTSSMAGYCMERWRFPGRKILNTLYTALMFVALGTVTIYPVFRLMYGIRLTNSLLGLALVLTGGQAGNIFLVRGFVKSIPKELDESAKLDGCGPLKLYFYIMLPLIRPIIAVVGLFAFRNTWNEYITSQIFTMGAPRLRPLTVAVISLRYSANAAAEWHIMTAGTVIALFPMLLLYAVTNKQFISGLTAGSVKG